MIINLIKIAKQFCGMVQLVILKIQILQKVVVQIAETIAEQKNKKFIQLLGGGDTVAFLNKFNLFRKYNFVSTAGGAFLEYLEGKIIPGIRALN